MRQAGARRRRRQLGAKAILASAGIAMSRDILVDSAEAAAATWAGIGGPVVLVASPDILHKTEIGEGPAQSR